MIEDDEHRSHAAAQREQELLAKLYRLERIAAEYTQLAHLIEYAAQGKSVDQYVRIGSLYIDPTSLHVIDANTVMIDLLGYSKADIVGLPIAVLEIEADTSQRAGMQRYIENGREILIYPALFRHRDGRDIPVRVNRRLLFKPDGLVIYYQVEDRSLSSLLWAELRQRAGQGFLFASKLKILNEITIALNRIEGFDDLCRAIVQSGIEQLGFDRMGMWFLDADRSVMVGSFGTDETGKLRDERGEAWSYADTYIEDYLAGKLEAAFTSYDAPLYNERHEIIEYGWHVAAPMMEGERFVGVLTADNYLRKQPMQDFEPELLRLYGITAGQLTALARARERAISARMERARTQVISQFVATAGHDFRNPLAVINTKAYLLQRVEDAEQRRTLVQDVQKQVRHINAMLNTMLEFVAVESDLVLTIALVDLRDLVQQAEQMHETLRVEKGLHFALNVEDAPSVLADPAYLRRAVSELILNAYEYTAAGGQVCVSFPHYETEIGIRVQDTGVGIPPEQIARIFEPLYRINEARTEQRSGLGLPIAKAIIEAHRGRITVTSTPGSGSTFEIILPRR